MANEQYGVTLTADSTQYQQSLQQSANVTNALTDALTRAGASMQSLWTKTNRKLTFIAAGEVAAITAATAAAGNLEQQMSQLQARQVLLHRGTEAYNGTVTRLRTSFGATSQDVIGLITQLNQLQVPFTQQEKTVSNYMKLAAVTGENVNGLAQSQQGFMRSMGSSQRTVENYSSMLAKLSANTGASATATADFATSIAPLSKTVGMNTKEVAGISAAFVKAGADGGAAANVYTKMLSDINRATQYGSPELKIYSDLIGVSTDRFKEMSKSEAITQIFENLNAQGPRAIKTLEQLGLEGVRSQRAINAVVGQGGLRESVGIAGKGYNDTKDFQDAAKKATEGLNDELGKLKETLASVAQGFGSIFVPAARGAVGVLNSMLSPITMITDFLNKLPDAAKSAGAALLGLGVAANFLPRIVAGLAGLTGVAQVLRGPLSQGVRAGFRPDRLNDVQRNFLAGGAAAGPTTLFASGQTLGRNLRPRTWVQRWGNDETLSRYDARMAAAAGGGGPFQRINRAGISAMAMGGSIARSFLLPWQPGYLNDASRMHRNPFVANMMATSSPTWSGAASNLPNWMQSVAKKLDLPGDKLREQYVQGRSNEMAARGASAKEIANFQKDYAEKLKTSTEELKRHTTVSGQARAEMGRFAKTAALAAGGAITSGGGMALRGAGAGIALGGRVLGGLLGSLGPLGIGMLGIAGIGAARSARTGGIAGGTVEKGEDVGAGHTYREALGIASRATMNFAEVVERNATSMDKAVTSVSEAVKVNVADVNEAVGKQVQDANIKRLSGKDLQDYVTAALFGATPKEAAALKGDLLAKMPGQTEAVQRLLSNGTASGARLTGLYGGISNANQDFGIINQQFGLSKANQEATRVAASTAQNQLSVINERLGPQQAAKFQASQFSDLIQANLKSAQRTPGFFDPTQFSGRTFGGSREGEGRQQAFMQFMGIGADDEQSKKDLNEAMERVGRVYATGRTPGSGQGGGGRFRRPGQKVVGGQPVGDLAAGATQDQIARDEMSRLAQQDSDIGRSMKAAMEAAGMNTNVGFTAGALKEDPLSLLGNTSTRSSMAIGSRSFANLFGTPGVNQQAVIRALQNEGNVGMAQTGSETLMGFAGGTGNLDATIANLQEMGSIVGQGNAPLRAMLQAAEQAAMGLRNYNNVMQGRTGRNEQATTALNDFRTAANTFRQNPNDPANLERLTKAKDAVRELAVSNADWMQQMADQYRAFDIQKQQGQEQLDRNRIRSERDYNLQRSQAEEDFSTQRERGYADFATQRNRSEADFRVSQQRAEQDFQRGRNREEEDHKVQIVRQAEDAAKSIYDIYHRVGTQQTWDAQSLLTNMTEQQQRIGEQQSNLTAVRKLGLSNKTITQLGLNESGNSQQLARLLQGLQEDPSLAGQYNKMAQSRQQGSGALLQDPSNANFQRSESDRKKNLKRGQADFDRSMDQQRTDFSKQMSRSAEDFSKAMGRSQRDYEKMRRRQQDFFVQGTRDMQDDFTIQMDIQEKNISTFAEDTSRSFTENYKIVEKRTAGETKKQVTNMNTLMDTLDYVVKTDIKDLNEQIMKPFNQWNVQPSTKPAPSGGNNSTQAGAHGPGGSHEESGGPNDSTDYTALGGSGDGGANSKHGWPLKSHRIGTPWGKRGSWSGSKTLGKGYHSGDDFPAGTGTAIHAAEDGEVVFTGWGGAYGNMTKIAHGNGVQTWYAHQSHIGTKKGNRVDQGDVIGKVGATGRAFGSHLHFEVRVNGRDIDPKKWLGGAATPAGGGGGSSATAPDPHFADMPAYKKWEATMSRLGYLNKNPQSFHPGSYWNKGELAKAITKEFKDQWTANQGANYSDPGGGGGVDSGGKGGARGVWNALRTGGLSEKQAAGVMGNIDHESNFKWNIHERSGGGGYGLVQWTPGSKLRDILKKGNKKDGLANQIWALLHQLAGKGPHAEGAAGRALRKADTVFEATKAFMLKYERPANQSDSNVRSRNRASEKWYKSFHGDALPSGGGGGDAGSSGGKGMAAAKKMGYDKGANPINRHSDPSGKPSFDMMIQNKTEGNNIAANLRKYHKDYGMEYVIWNMKIASNRENWKWRQYHPITNQGDYKHVHHVHSTYAQGTNAATPGWSLVGEQGPEFIKMKGGERVLNSIQSKYAVMAAKAGQVINASHGGTSVTNNRFDHSVQVASVTVKADSPRAMIAELEREARLAALTGVK